MAKMYPTYNPRSSDSKTAEPTIYRKLSEQLSDEFTVIHSLPWLSSATSDIAPRRIPTGEIDFLILHQDLGILVIEVKGGECFIREGEFFVKMKHNIIKQLHPVNQIRQGTHALAKILGSKKIGFFRIGYCLLFPECEMQNAIAPALMDYTVDPPQPIVLDNRSIRNLGQEIQDVMCFWKKSLGTCGISKSKIDEIVSILLPTADYTPSWKSRIGNDTDTWLTPTSEQLKCLDKIKNEKRCVITGSSGTGKTLLLIEQAKRLSIAGEDLIIITFNRKLAEYLHNELSELGIDVYVFNELCLVSNHLIGSPYETGNKDWYEGTALESLNSAIDSGKLENYDSLLVDEGQALNINKYKTFDRWFRDKKITVFCDPTQSFSFEDRIQPEVIAKTIGSKAPYTLTVNLRSPLAIFHKMSQVASSDYQQSSPRPFQADTLIEIVAEDMQEELDRIIDQLEGENLKEHTVIIGAMYGANRIILNLEEGKTRYRTTYNFRLLSELDNTDSQREFSLEHTEKSCKYRGIEIVSAPKFRGLESPVVIVWAGSKCDDVTLLCSYARATSRCIAIYQKTSIVKGRYETFGQLLLASNVTL